MGNRTMDPSFDSAAKLYDNEFTFSEIGKLQRDRVYFWLNKINFFKKPKRVFEVNCGTGYDAKLFTERGHQVTATDGSEKMLEVAQKRNPELDIYQRKFIDISIDDNIGKSEAVFSNFGGLNCLSEEQLLCFINETAAQQKVGDLLISVIMPNHCFIADLFHFLTGKFNQIRRRNREEFLEVNVNGESIRTYYHHPATVSKLLYSNYKVLLKKPIAIFLPPSYTELFFKRNKWALKGLYLLERIFGNLSFLSSKADHYIIVAERK
ncbi:MAG: methyltransferase domain-containing protein [Flavobacteriales bacterium]|nr:methyltransferase domain-containing protein [Flavobacteriales bacterium]